MSDGHGFPADEPPGPAPDGAGGSAPWTTPGGDGPSGPAAPPPPPPPSGPGPYGPPGGSPYGAPGPRYGAPPPYGGAPYGYPPSAAPQPGIIPLRPLRVGEILDGTVKLIRHNPGVVLGLSVVVAAVGTLPVVIESAFLPSPDDLLREFALNPDSFVLLQNLWDRFLFPLIVGTLITAFVHFFAVTALTGVLTRILGRAVFGGRIGAGEAWTLSASRVPALIGVALLTALLLIAPLVPIMGLLALLVASDVGLGLLLFGLAALGWVVYCVIVYTRLALTAPAIVLEGHGPISAMGRSWRLVRGDTWRVFGILLLAQVIVFLLDYALNIPFSFLGGLMPGRTASLVLAAIAAILVAAITYPVQAGVVGLLYADRRMRAEAFDLALQTAAMDQQRLGWVPPTVDDLWHPDNATGGSPYGGYGQENPPYGFR